MTIQWPIETLIPAQITRRVAPRTTAGTVSASGFTQRVSAPAHAWVIEYAGIPVATAAQRAAWDATEALLDGGANAVLVYLPGEGADPDGTMQGDTTAGDVEVVINRTEPVEAGSHFSIGERLYRVASVVDVDSDDYTVTIRPPLRSDVDNGSDVIFSTLACKCRLMTDDEMALQINSARVGFGNVKFVEDPSE